MRAANMQMLASFGARYSDGWRLVGNYAGRILKGEKPSDLPVQQVSRTELENIQSAGDHDAVVFASAC
jgi:putative tryptophan/tyrosine transport system substrate-binding protein